MNVTMRAKTGRRWRLLEGLRALWDRSFARIHFPSPLASSSANLPPVSSTDRCASRPLRGGAILIANLELEFHVNPIRITKLRFSNRKYSQLFRPLWRVAISRSAVSSAVASRPLALGRPGAEGPLVRKFLIGTQGLEFRAIKTKQTPSSSSNCYKTRFSRFASLGESYGKGAGRRPAVRTANSKDAGRMPALQGRKRTAKEPAHAGVKHRVTSRWLIAAQAEAYATCTAGLRPAPLTLGSFLVAPASCRLFCVSLYGSKKVLKERRRWRVGRYVYDSEGADLSCGVGRSDYDVRS